MGRKKFDQIAIIGLGLIGSSICRAVKERGLCKKITGHDRLKRTRDKAIELGFVDEIFAKPDDAVVNADLVILCVPVGANKKLAKSIGKRLKDTAIVTDTGSVKSVVVRDVVPMLPDGVVFVPGHPVAGTEHSGPEAGFASLFEGKWCLLTPPKGTPKASVQKVADFWRACGARIDFMSAEHHDFVLAITSHLPHLIAFNIVGMSATLEEVTKSEIMEYSAGGFRDFTRIASSDPKMWQDIFTNNKDIILDVLGHFNEQLALFSRAIRIGDEKEIKKHLDHARIIRNMAIMKDGESDK